MSLKRLKELKELEEAGKVHNECLYGCYCSANTLGFGG
jgi:hypothetical protein